MRHLASVNRAAIAAVCVLVLAVAPATASSQEDLARVDERQRLIADEIERIEAALAQYEEALGRLEDTAAARTWIERTFSPEIPVRLPAFYPNPLVTTEQGSLGHIDIAFSVDTHGRSRKVRILDTTENAPATAEKRLQQLIERSRFRPQLVDGRFADTDSIVVRYYLNE